MANEVPGFSAEEHVSDIFWWTDDPEQDPLISRDRIFARIKEEYPWAAEEQIRKVMK